MSERWPELPWEGWKETAATLHMWTQIVGKVRMTLTPRVNHSWHVTLYDTPRGLTTSAIPYGERTFQIGFDFHDHQLRMLTCDDERRDISLRPQTTADFYAAVMDALKDLKLDVDIHGRPNEVEPAIPFAEDTRHASYDPEAAHRFWRVLLQVDRVFRRFRAGFVGKSSPSHFFWGSFDLAVTRFSGRPAPPHPGGYPNIPLEVMQEAYSHEVSSAGFYPGGEGAPFAFFYSYAYPVPDGMSEAPVSPAAAAWNRDLGEFVLNYDAVRTARQPTEALMQFLETTYLAAARTGNWDLDAFKPSFPARTD